MTRFGTDISSYQAGLRLKDLQYAEFVIAKCSQGVGYTDPDYQAWRQEAATLGKPFGWYHFLETASAGAQITHTVACVGDKTLPGMLDVEPYGLSRPNIADVLAYHDASIPAGLSLRLVYWPHWYWVECGSPDLTRLKERGLILVSSAYPGRTGNPIQIYPGNDAAGWTSYGNMDVGMYQYTSLAPDGGQNLDYNAIRDDSVFHSIFGGDIVTPQDIQAIAEACAAAVYRYGIEDVVINGSVEHNTPLGNMVHGAWVATNEADGPLFKFLSDMLVKILAAVAAAQPDPAALARTITAAIDVNALATAIDAHLTANPGASPTSIATAVAGYFAQKLGTP